MVEISRDDKPYESTEIADSISVVQYLLEFFPMVFVD